jgi:transposase
MVIFVGDDWAEDHHDVHLMDETGSRLAARRFPEGAVGIGGLHALIAQYADDPGQVVVGIETDRGLWAGALAAAGYQVFAINPLAAARYRERHQLSGAKSDPGDGKVLADLGITAMFREVDWFSLGWQTWTDRTPLNPIGVGDVRPSAGH